MRASFVTNELGRRVSKTDSGGTTSYLFDGSNVVADSRAEYTRGGATGLLSEQAGRSARSTTGTARQHAGADGRHADGGREPE